VADGLIVYVFYIVAYSFYESVDIIYWLTGCERLSIKVDPEKIQLLKQQYRELIEATNKQLREDEAAQERLQKSLRVTPDACIERSSRT